MVVQAAAAISLGLVFPFLGEQFRGGERVDVIAVEPASCPTLTKGVYAYDFGDTANLTPLLKMHTLGSKFVPPTSHAGGLRYHGMAPLVSLVCNLGFVRPRSYTQIQCFDAGVEFARSEGILPAPEANHAVAAAVDEANRCKEEGVPRTILFNLCGHGNFDMQAYTDYFSGSMKEYEYSPDEVAMALAGLPSIG